MLSLRYNDTNDDSEHINGAVLLILDDISEKASEGIPNQDKIYYVYYKSATAVQLLVDIGYKNIYDLGGINDLAYETFKY